MKENLQAFLTGIGCTPLLAIGFFIIGAFIGQFIKVNVPAPPQWLLFLAALFPVCFGFYLRAYTIKKNIQPWFEQWRNTTRRKIVGRAASVEEFWFQSQVQTTAKKNIIKRIIDNPQLWGWVVLLCLLALAYICLWVGLNAVSR